MKKTIAAIAITLALVSAGFVIVTHYQRKHEDDVAYFALRAIRAHTQKIDCTTVAKLAAYQERCVSEQSEMQHYRKTHTSDELFDVTVACVERNGIRVLDAMGACFARRDSEEADSLAKWAVKYPTQAADLKRDALAEARKRDARQMEAPR